MYFEVNVLNWFLLVSADVGKKAWSLSILLTCFLGANACCMAMPKITNRSNATTQMKYFFLIFATMLLILYVFITKHIM